MAISGAKFAVRPLFDEDSGSSAGWQIIEVAAEDNGSVYGYKIGAIDDHPLNVSSLAFVQLLVSECRDRLNARGRTDASMVEESGDGGGPAAPTQ